MNNVDVILERLSKSNFRSKFHLDKKMKEYALEKGMDVIREHAYDFILGRLAGDDVKNDGKQTPMKGHPVFIAQHACACCCRGCLSKWHNIPKGRKMTSEEVDYVVNLIMKWIKNEVVKNYE